MFEGDDHDHDPWPRLRAEIYTPAAEEEEEKKKKKKKKSR